MLTLYLLGLGTGGVLLVLSLFGGGDASDEHAVGADDDIEIEVDVDGEIDGEAGDHGEHGDGGRGGFGDVLAVLPIASLRFWTFFLAFAGLTGTLLTLLHAVGPVLAAVLSGFAGWLAGVSVTTFTRWLGRTQVTSTLERQDFVGASGTVVLPMGRGVRGRIRVSLENQLVDVDAETDDERGLTGADPVVVYAVRDDGVVLVTSSRGRELPTLSRGENT